jgi:hypothetical protein
MTGRRPLDDAELIERLGALSAELAWPATPDLAGRVTAALEARPARTDRTTGVLGRLRELIGAGAVSVPGGRRIARRSLAIAVVALLAIAVAAAAIGLGVPGIRIDLRPVATPTVTPATSAPGPSSSTAAAGESPTIRATPPGQELGPTVSLDQARSGIGFGLLVPTATGYTDPAEVHLTGAQPFSRVSFRYPDGTLLTQFLGEIEPDAFQKIVGGGTTVEPVRVGTSDGYWIAGAPHELFLSYRDPDGLVRWQQVTVTGNVLLWQTGTVTLRLETPLDRAAAIAVATSLR